MATKLKIKKGDRVVVISGEDKGKQGEVRSVNREKLTVTVEGVNIIKKHKKPSATDTQGGIKEVEGPVHVSNVKLLDAKGNATRVGRRLEGDKIVRYSKKSGEVIK